MPGFVPRPAHGTARFGELLGKAMTAHGPGPSRPAGDAAPTAAPPTPAVQRVAKASTVAPTARAALVSAIRHASVTAGVDPALSVAVARAESNLNPRARSSDGLSVGTFQVTDATAAEMRRKIAAGTVTRPPGTDDVALGVGYLRYLNDLFGKRARLTRDLVTTPVADADERRLFAVAAFNAGEGRVAQAQARAAAAGGDPTRFADVRRFLPTITRGYVDRVAGYQRAEGSGTQVA
jgi:soluble lytic murein transglycosylase-like protein